MPGAYTSVITACVWGSLRSPSGLIIFQKDSQDPEKLLYSQFKFVTAKKKNTD